jgi:hypothetical protein
MFLTFDFMAGSFANRHVWRHPISGKDRNPEFDDNNGKYFYRHGRASSRPSTSLIIGRSQDVDARHKAGHDDLIGHPSTGSAITS